MPSDFNEIKKNQEFCSLRRKCPTLPTYILLQNIGRMGSVCAKHHPSVLFEAGILVWFVAALYLVLRKGPGRRAGAQ